MVYKRKGGKSLYFEGRLRDGRRKQLCTYTTSRALAGKIEAMWEALAVEHRAWDLLELVLTDAVTIGRLFDLWTETKQHPIEMRRRVNVVDLEPLVAEWATWYAGEVKADSAQHALVHVRALIPEGTPCPAVSIDVKRLTQFLTAYEGKRNTRRKVHSSLTGFFRYATKVHGAYAANPMLEVDRPAQEESPIRFYEQDQVERIVGWQPTEQRRALFALYYGTAMEASLPPRLTRRDVDPTTHEVRMAGTKARTRDRVGKVADWAWPIVWGYLSQFLPDGRPWAGIDRWIASDWHRQTVGAGTKDKHGKVVAPGLNLPERHPLHCARDHWAVMRMRAGVPVQVVADQLGHGDANLTFKKYGRFKPGSLDRERMEQQVAEYNAARATAAETARPSGPTSHRVG